MLDPIFIFGLDMGMKGAALATVIGQIFAGWLVFRYLCRYKAHPLERRHLRPQRKYAGHLISLGMSACFNQLAIMVAVSYTHLDVYKRQGWRPTWTARFCLI